jgi:hypothetical protein
LEDSLAISVTPCFSKVMGKLTKQGNRFNGFDNEAVETAEPNFTYP